MRLAALARRAAQRVLGRFGYTLVPDGLLYEWQQPAAAALPPGPRTVSPEARGYLTPDNPRLLELKEAYARVSAAVTTPAVWTADYARSTDLSEFRADNPYVWQLRGRDMNELSYALAYYYLKATDQLRLLERLEEDGAFGALTFEIDGRRVSRDLLDSVSELNFLERNLALDTQGGLTVLDIGAGYGRLAHRTVAAVPAVARYLCTDAVPVSTFLCEYYLRYRGADARAQVVPLHEIERTLPQQAVDLAINVHSFSECRLEAIDWWLSLLRAQRVPRLMVVPNRVGADGTTMLTNAGEDFSRIVTGHGYRLLVREPRYADRLVQKYGLSAASYFLFSL